MHPRPEGDGSVCAARGARLEDALPRELLELVLTKLPEYTPAEQSRVMAACVCRRWRRAVRESLTHYLAHTLRSASPQAELQQLVAWSGRHQLRRLTLGSSPGAEASRLAGPWSLAPLGSAAHLDSLELCTALDTDWASLAACTRLTRLVIRSPPVVRRAAAAPGQAVLTEGQAAELRGAWAALRGLGRGLLPLARLARLDLKDMLDLWPLRGYAHIDDGELAGATAWLSRLTQLSMLRTSHGTRGAWGLPRLVNLWIRHPRAYLELASVAWSSRLTSLFLMNVDLRGPFLGLPPSLRRLWLWTNYYPQEGTVHSLASLRGLTELGFSGGRAQRPWGVVDFGLVLAHPQSGLRTLSGLRVLKVDAAWDPSFLVQHAPGLGQLEELHLALPMCASPAAVAAWRDMAFLACLDSLPRLRLLQIKHWGAFEGWDLPPRYRALLEGRGCRWAIGADVAGYWADWG